MSGVTGMTDAVTAMIDMTGMMTGMIDARGMIERMVRKGDHGRNYLVRKGSRQERPMRNTHPRERRWASSSLRQDPHPWGRLLDLGLLPRRHLLRAKEQDCGMVALRVLGCHRQQVHLQPWQ